MAEVLKIGEKPKTKEELWAYFQRKYLSEELKHGFPPAKPKPKPTVMLEVEPATAAQVQARPESVRLVTMRDDDMQAVARARPKEIVHVLEVDAEGRPSRARVVDCATGTAGFVDYRDGYRQMPSVVSDWNPLDGLRRPEDE